MSEQETEGGVKVTIHRVTINQFAAMIAAEAKRRRTLNNKSRLGLGNIKLMHDITGYHHTAFYGARAKGGANYLQHALILLQASKLSEMRT